ncbi:MAG: hypothetical protein AVDCRST_MAG07-2631 [uncultured Frankineae bacterium]|uniref:Uncharacterized protein n=1 Tax=uncultured Frankineae bacterium TaxID=437475 RepID=A0A6J4LYI3_9ACTN|nr:MAG: hypothetical protein AVDCRST_MAG07-2631 [uncultured Frankineae bacterium]
MRRGPDGRRLTALAVVAYAETPVGPYAEALLAELRAPLRLHVPWIVVDSAASARAGREHWALPKQLASLALDLPRSGRLVAPPPVGEVGLTARPLGPWLPLAARALLDQPGRPPARLRFRGRVRPAVVRVSGGPAPGRGPGLELDGVLRLAAPVRQDGHRLG